MNLIIPLSLVALVVVGTLGLIYQYLQLETIPNWQDYFTKRNVSLSSLQQLRGGSTRPRLSLCEDYNGEDNMMCAHVLRANEGKEREERCNKPVGNRSPTKNETQKQIKHFCRKSCGLCDDAIGMDSSSHATFELEYEQLDESGNDTVSNHDQDAEHQHRTSALIEEAKNELTMAKREPLSNNVSQGQGSISAQKKRKNGEQRKYSVGTTVSFYVYPTEDFPLFFGPNTTCDHRKINEKHGIHHFALEEMMRHPWRTTNPLKADIAVIPSAIDLFSRQRCPGLQGSDVLREIEKAIAKSPIFPQKRHLVIANDWKSSKFARGDIMHTLEPAGIMLGMEGRGECFMSGSYLSNYAVESLLLQSSLSLMKNPLKSPKERSYSVNMVGQADGRQAYQERLALFQSGTKRRFENETLPYSFIVTQNAGQHVRRCRGRDDTDRCFNEVGYPSRFDTQKALELSNYTLALRGDTLGSDRWINAMSAGTAVIQVSVDHQKALEWLPYPCAIPWEDLILDIPREIFMKNPVCSIRTMTESITNEKLWQLQHLSRYFTRDIDWNAYQPRVLDNILREAYFTPCKMFEAQFEPEYFLKPLIEQDWCTDSQATARNNAHLHLHNQNLQTLGLSDAFTRIDLNVPIYMNISYQACF